MFFLILIKFVRFHLILFHFPNLRKWLSFCMHSSLLLDLFDLVLSALADSCGNSRKVYIRRPNAKQKMLVQMHEQQIMHQYFWRRSWNNFRKTGKTVKFEIFFWWVVEKAVKLYFWIFQRTSFFFVSARIVGSKKFKVLYTILKWVVICLHRSSSRCFYN